MIGERRVQRVPGTARGRLRLLTGAVLLTTIAGSAWTDNPVASGEWRTRSSRASLSAKIIIVDTTPCVRSNDWFAQRVDYPFEYIHIYIYIQTSPRTGRSFRPWFASVKFTAAALIESRYELRPSPPSRNFVTHTRTPVSRVREV